MSYLSLSYHYVEFAVHPHILQINHTMVPDCDRYLYSWFNVTNNIYEDIAEFLTPTQLLDVSRDITKGILRFKNLEDAMLTKLSWVPKDD